MGLGNPLHGDDAVGPVVAQAVCELLRHRSNVDLLESPAMDARLAEYLVGYQKAVIIDALIDPKAEPGTLTRVGIAGDIGVRPANLHTGGFRDLLTLARMVGLAVPDSLRVYGVVIRTPCPFFDGLSPALTARVPAVAEAIAAEEMHSARCLRRRASLSDWKPNPTGTYKRAYV